MVTRADFSDEEWKTIYQSPAMAGMVVMMSGKSGPFQAVKEMFAVGRALADVDKAGTSNSLISAIVAHAKSNEKMEQPIKPESIEEARTIALDHVRQTVALVDAKAPDEAAEFKRWLATIGVKVAEAAKEGSVLGFGGTQVTDEERAAIHDLNVALGITSAGL